jgi:hypothetical protein
MKPAITRCSALLAAAAVMLPCALTAAAAAPPKSAPSSTARVSTDVRGPKRKAILDALRPTVERDLKQKVLFRVDKLRATNDWAFLSGAAVRPDGGPIDYRKTRYADALNSGAFDDWLCALLRRKNGRWTVTAYALGATDVTWAGWDTDYKAPRALFPYDGK